MSTNIIPRLLHLGVAVLLALPIQIHAQTPSATPTSAEVSKLRDDAEKLRLENQRLRQLLAQPDAKAPNAPAAPAAPARSPQPSAKPTEAPTAPPATAPQGLTHWMTSSSSKRHNSKCRWFHTSKGRPCGPTEGIPCSICGG